MLVNPAPSHNLQTSFDGVNLLVAFRCTALQFAIIVFLLRLIKYLSLCLFGAIVCICNLNLIDASANNIGPIFADKEG